ncbi:efflux RND transporter periplasmic adaptor subunit [Terrimonas sp. NA20]|uniref:Efflux RND transporter periplasmic adaptor subunit n=1 Tax=Terrimonas ginsenosidimutans TaxID=2908004 RepID=A0ABS9L0C5_9BACT|nr:efflux RND transporter periplasmic adaptor subunit [Terrimonas ginsenosidimutans]MCG2618020.1 efflux RND transporter periplasmic adaptor subunit [Terrimonas ginsenosidimutans]
MYTTKIVFWLLAGTTLLSSCVEKKDQQQATTFANETIPVKTIAVERLTSSFSIASTGLLTTENEVNYSFKIGGIIESIKVSEGQFFKRGQLLATLKITEIDAQATQASLGYEKAKRDFTRADNLYRDSVATLEQLQNAKTNLDIARKTVDAVEFNKRYAYIYADANGFVAKKLANEGEVVNAGMPVLAINESSGASDWILRVGVTDKEWATIQIGDKASVTLDAFPEQVFPAKVFRKSQAADIASSSFQIELKMALGAITPAVGLFGKAEIETKNTGDMMVIPYASLVEADGNKGYVFTTQGLNKVKKIPVTILKFDNNKVYLKDKFSNDEQIVVSNSAYLNEQSSIKIIQ